MTGPAFQFYCAARACHAFNLCNSCKHSSNCVSHFPQLQCWLCVPSSSVLCPGLSYLMFSEALHNAAVKLIECLMSTPLPPRRNTLRVARGRAGQEGALRSAGCDADLCRHLGRVRGSVCARCHLPRLAGLGAEVCTAPKCDRLRAPLSAQKWDRF